MEKTQNTCNTETKQEITIKERLEMLLSSVTDLKEFILNAETAETVQNHLNKLAAYLQDAKGDKIPYVSSLIEEVTLPAVRQFRLNDITRKEFAKLLDELIEHIKKRIAQEEKEAKEEKNKNVEKLRNLLLGSAEKAEKKRNVILEQAKELEKQRNFFLGHAEKAEELIDDPLWLELLK